MDNLKLVLFKSMIKMQELAKISCPVFHGVLRNSIILNPSSPGYSNYELGAGVNYAASVEYGTRPHYTSPENIKDWAKSKLGNESAAFAIAKKIAKFGTEAQPFFRPSLSQVKNIWVKKYMSGL